MTAMLVSFAAGLPPLHPVWLAVDALAFVAVAVWRALGAARSSRQAAPVQVHPCGQCGREIPLGRRYCDAYCRDLAGLERRQRPVLEAAITEADRRRGEAARFEAEQAELEAREGIPF